VARRQSDPVVQLTVLSFHFPLRLSVDAVAVAFVQLSLLPELFTGLFVPRLVAEPVVPIVVAELPLVSVVPSALEHAELQTVFETVVRGTQGSLTSRESHKEREAMLTSVKAMRVMRGAAAAAVLGAFGLLGAGCVVDADDCVGCHGEGDWGGYGGSPVGNDGGPSEEIITATIKSDQYLETTAGEGAGVFVDYTTGGSWRVYTACDTKFTSVPCDFNVVVTVGSGDTLTGAQLEDDEASDGDTLYTYSDGVEMAVRTRNDFDALRFSTTPGAVVRFELFLGGVRDGRYLYWVGEEAVHNGAPSNPVDLKPSSP